jgi:hypothetical protein
MIQRMTSLLTQARATKEKTEEEEDKAHQGDSLLRQRRIFLFPEGRRQRLREKEDG